MSDSVFHGLRSILGADIVDAPKQETMYKSCVKDLTHAIHGRGFTLSKTLDDIEVDRTDIESKIKNKYFDYIIYGVINSGITVLYDYLELVHRTYPDDKIVYIDGADPKYVISDLLGNGWYFKRELFEENPNMKPISFSVPKEKFQPFEEWQSKEYMIAPLVPGYMQTFIYDDETKYYEMYRKSLFGLTWKKAGWDCLRHYEIMMCGCIPLFVDIHHCPESILTIYPKDLAKKALELPGLSLGFDPKQIFEYTNLRISNVDFSKIDFQTTEFNMLMMSALLDEMYSYAQKNLTTEVTAKYILDTIQGNSSI